MQSGLLLLPQDALMEKWVLRCHGAKFFQGCLGSYRGALLECPVPIFPCQGPFSRLPRTFPVIPAETESPPALNGVWPCSDVSGKQVIAPLKVEAGDPLELLSPPCLRNHSAVRSSVSSRGSQVGKRTCTSF